ncbi:MAG TPA: sulfite exporter TauE/SafE family protein [Gammaproteobacteria bacterium]|nr:sulfite exporter TauE/SafE family protein [Gammaproteobacteria bacterium]
MLFTIPAYLAIGALTGLLAGLLGIGGGLIVVPALLYLFAWQDVAEAARMHLAIGTSLATIVLTSTAAVHAHHRRRAVDWPIVAHLTPGLFAGGAAGAALAGLLPAGMLRALFGLFALAMAVHVAFEKGVGVQERVPRVELRLIAGLAIGVLAALVGVGGGILVVPFLLWSGTSPVRAVATSAACTVPIALAGAAGYIIIGWDDPLRPAWSTGYVLWPAALTIAAASMLFAPLGVALAHRLPYRHLRRLFALVLLAVAADLLLGG